jgi:RNA polymerase sigma-70 factor (ECF subfamily)
MPSFDTTRWTLVLAAGGDDSAAARRALGDLCETYWYPLYAFLRRRGESPDDARDLTQGFLASLLARQSFGGLGPERGRFRAFMLASLQHFAANERAAARAAKRGGGVPALSLDTPMEGAEQRYRLEPADAATPERLYERRWALIVIDRVLTSLRARWAADGRGAEFDALKSSLMGDTPAGGYARLASDLDTTEGAIKVAVHRLRRRFQDELRRQIGATVADSAEVDDEIQYLIRSLGA